MFQNEPGWCWGAGWELSNQVLKLMLAISPIWKKKTGILHFIFEATSRPSTHTMENSFVPVTHSLFCSREIMFYLKILKAARFSLSLRVCSFFVSSPDMYSTVRLTTEEELTLNTFHLPLLAIHLITVRDLSKEESMLYFVHILQFKGSHKRLHIPPPH